MEIPTHTTLAAVLLEPFTLAVDRRDAAHLEVPVDIELRLVEDRARTLQVEDVGHWAANALRFSRMSFGKVRCSSAA